MVTHCLLAQKQLIDYVRKGLFRDQCQVSFGAGDTCSFSVISMTFPTKIMRLLWISLGNHSKKLGRYSEDKISKEADMEEMN